MTDISERTVVKSIWLLTPLGHKRICQGLLRRSRLYSYCPAQAAKDAGIELIVITLPEAKKVFALLPKRWGVERSFAWAARFRRLARDFERAPEILRGLHSVVFSILMPHNLVRKILESS